MIKALIDVEKANEFFGEEVVDTIHNLFMKYLGGTGLSSDEVSYIEAATNKMIEAGITNE